MSGEGRAEGRLGKQVVLGVDVGGTNVKVALVDDVGNVVIQDSWSTESSRGANDFAARLKASRDDLLAKAGLDSFAVVAIGLGMPGFLNLEDGMLEESPNLHWKRVPIIRTVTDLFACPVFMDNDANLAALGEVWLGAGRSAKNAIAITLGTGVGGGIILDGKVYHGAAVMAGEIGHIPILPGGELCNCGHVGCLETLASATALERHGRERGLTSPCGEGHSLVSEDIFALAQGGNQAAQEVIADLVHWLAVGLAILANTLNPDVMIISGGLVQAGDALMMPLREEFSKLALRRAVETCQVVPATLGAKAGVLGAARLAWQNMA